MGRVTIKWELRRQSDGVSLLNAINLDQLENMLTYKNVFEHVDVVERKTGKILQSWGARNYDDLDPEPSLWDKMAPGATLRARA